MDLNKRVTQLNDCSEKRKAGYVLYWMQMFKRASHNYALNFAIQMANDRSLPLVVYEGLKYYYPWANDRLHTFILEGVPEKTEKFVRLGMRYIFYLQRKASDSKNTVTRLAKNAALLVTDDFPCFINPEHNSSIASQGEHPGFRSRLKWNDPPLCFSQRGIRRPNNSTKDQAASAALPRTDSNSQTQAQSPRAGGGMSRDCGHSGKHSAVG